MPYDCCVSMIYIEKSSLIPDHYLHFGFRRRYSDNPHQKSKMHSVPKLMDSIFSSVIPQMLLKRGKPELLGEWNTS